MSEVATFVRGFGSYLPAQVVGNLELADRLGCDADWIRKVSGIEERRFAAAEETVADLAAAAGRDCLVRSGLVASEVGMLIVASGSSERRFPGPAATVAGLLGLHDAPAIDLPMASAGSLFGMALASQVASFQRNVLVIGAEKMSEVALRPPLDPRLSILFGDGAGACVVSTEGGPARLVDRAIFSDGNFASILQLGFSGPLVMDGPAVVLHASRRLPRVIQEVLSRNRLTVGEVGTYLTHQANGNLTDQLARSLGVPGERFFSNIRNRGNTSSASLLIAAAEWTSVSGFRPDIPVVLAALGAGLHWGALLLVGVEPAAGPA